MLTLTGEHTVASHFHTHTHTHRHTHTLLIIVPTQAQEQVSFRVNHLQSISKMNNQLKEIYYGDSIGAFRGPQALYAEAKRQQVDGVTLEACKEFLKGEAAYTLHKPARRHYPRNKIHASYPGDVVQIDIMDMQNFRRFNTYSYVLLSYDSFSKHLMGMPLKSRSVQEVETGLKALINKAPYSFQRIYWDKEGSFLSKRVQHMLSERRIINYTTTSTVKAPGVER